MLALVGDKDRVVAVDTFIPALKAALGASPHAEVRRLPDLNHFFQTAGSGEFSEVEGIAETMSSRAGAHRSVDAGTGHAIAHIRFRADLIRASVLACFLCN
ncbi:hypothetical protein LQ564_12365 [Massilia sp. G4R7]|uniref:Dienelactone hydrolase domain-containing protein n=1 Tax=Massilia phyllostachyos TaxID=2898585 RepID=A0ABS8Q932_9BURK|nr:hypothetical protein [Massilia phyllostachyos]MCD2517100.1 hypothetical protein [Massilia phyllostachyos]